MADTKLTITVPGVHRDRVLNAIAAEKGYPGTGTKVAFAKTWIIGEIRRVVARHEVEAKTPDEQKIKNDVDLISFT
jgi:hypothetical protein|tara:strand:- start:495 stop:722 length:228 start_codon:yes stop_codon:yes gene_type:complete